MKQQLVAELNVEFVRFLTVDYYCGLVIVNRTEMLDVYDYIKSQLPDERFGMQSNRKSLHFKLGTSSIRIVTPTHEKWHQDLQGFICDAILLDLNSNNRIVNNECKPVTLDFGNAISWLTTRLKRGDENSRMVIL